MTAPGSGLAGRMPVMNCSILPAERLDVSEPEDVVVALQFDEAPAGDLLQPCTGQRRAGRLGRLAGLGRASGHESR